MKIEFLGAAKVVTGSNYLITTDKWKFLIDCGLFQGGKEEEAMNELAFKYDPGEIDFMFLTHAHIDHSGRIPYLVKKGYRSEIYATEATVDLCEIMLLDSANIQESDAEWENKRRIRSGKAPIEPLYTMEDAQRSLSYFRPCHYEEIIKVNDEISFRFTDAGHILGSSILELWIVENNETVKVVFSGDLGMPNKPLLKDPAFIKSADYLIMESTYGNSVHDDYAKSMDELTQIIDRVSERGGTVMIPSFAVGRTQELIYQLNNYYSKDTIHEHQRIPIYIDSPMAIRATKAFMDNAYYFDDETKEIIRSGDNIFEFPNLHYVNSVEESKALHRVNYPRVIISSSGMANAGRIRHHLKHGLWDERNAVVFIGYQAIGTLGRILLDGAEKVKLLGEEIAVKAEIFDLVGFSAHADEPMLLDWLNHFEKKPVKIFLTHGEEDESVPLAKTIKEMFHIDTIVPSLNDEYSLNTTGRDLEEKISKEDMEKTLYEDFRLIQDNMQNLSNRKELFDTGKMKAEEYSEIKRTLNDLKLQLMSLNMKTGK
ncbi:MBL fold metallo-hydrolase RNA specificity domain-containing protein [Gallicola sp. Sow4_E12]|uniref:MBL fold metallo-hydrolase RNA specificity domain-containing protein n=1 Tax=Gallicola sp. Sow4_E12 TaxID=3438785 RepID=UPI003F9016A5